MAFVAPWVLFLGARPAPERAYTSMLLKALPDRYRRLVEPAAGSFAIALLARELRWPAERIEASDVSLYSSALGCAIEGRAVATLYVRVDGEPFLASDDPIQGCAEVLAAQVRIRIAHRVDKNPTRYMAELLDDLEERQDEHVAEIARGVARLVEVLAGARYRPLDLVEHITEASSDPSAVIVANPPSYKAGYEKFFDTGGRLTWAEPPFAMFDPKEGTKKLMEAVADAPALVICSQECEPGGQVSSDPIYARFARPDVYVYLMANRPDEVFGYLGGPKVVPRSAAKLERPERPLLPPEHEVARESTLGVERITSAEAAYLKQLWAHRIKPSSASMNWALIVDGHVAGISGYEQRTLPGSDGSWRWGDHIFVMYTFAPYHPQRLLRLLIATSLQRFTLDTVIPAGSRLWVDGLHHVLTVMMTPHPESKPNRGLMKLAERRKEKDGTYRLLYEAPIEGHTPAEVLAAWLDKEEQWKRSSSR